MIHAHVSAGEFRAKLGPITSRVKHGGERVVVVRNGHPEMAAISMRDLYLLLLIERSL